MLGRVVGRIPNERFRIDDQPWLAFRAQNVAGMQVRCQQNLSGCTRWQLLKQLQTFADKCRIEPMLGLRQRLLAPILCQAAYSGRCEYGFRSDVNKDSRRM